MADLKIYYLSKFINFSGYCLACVCILIVFARDDSFCALSHTNKSSKRPIIKQNGWISSYIYSRLYIFYVNVDRFCSSFRTNNDISIFDRHGCYVHQLPILVLKAPNKTNKFAFQTNEQRAQSALSNLSLIYSLPQTYFLSLFVCFAQKWPTPNVHVNYKFQAFWVCSDKRCIFGWWKLRISSILVFAFTSAGSISFRNNWHLIRQTFSSFPLNLFSWLSSSWYDSPVSVIRVSVFVHVHWL